MNISSKGAAFIRTHEGFVASWYLDPVGVPTIGVGFTWRSNSFREWWQRNRSGEVFGKTSTMTRAEADDALAYLIDQEYGAAVSDFLGGAVPQHVFDGAVSPVYNLGTGALEWKWAAALKRGDIGEAARLLRTTGTTAKGKRLRGLIVRRQEEAELIELGDYTAGKMPTDPLVDGLLTRGERGAPVIQLQERLAQLGHYTGKVDGIFGYGTEAAVLALQRAAGLKADGVVGPKTEATLSRADIPPPPDVPPIPAEALPEGKGGNLGLVLFLLALAVIAAAILFLPIFPRN